MRAKSRFAVGVLAVGLFAAAQSALSGADSSKQPARVTLVKEATRIEFRHGTALTATYHFGPQVAKPYFWPLNTPDGPPITRGWPMVLPAQTGELTDHVHQKSAWFCHGDVIPEGMPPRHKIKGVMGIDFWSEAPGHGRIVCTHVGPVQQEGNRGQIATHNEWRTAEGVKILDEARTIQLVNYGAAQLLVLDIDLEASVVPIIFGDTKEGALGVRVRTDITEDKGKGKITNADGRSGERGPKGCWGRLSAWCDYSGPVEGRMEGITIFADPDNPYPSCWHSRGYGLMAANPFARKKSGFPALKDSTTPRARLAKGQHLRLRYGILLHRGDVADGHVADYYQRFVRLKKKG